jgi:hypothetical protein
MMDNVQNCDRYINIPSSQTNGTSELINQIRYNNHILLNVGYFSCVGIKFLNTLQNALCC